MASALRFCRDFDKYEELPDGSLIIEGICSTEAEDSDGEVISAEAMRAAIPECLLKGSVREQHNPNIASGLPLEMWQDDEKQTWIKAKVVDAGTVKKIKEKVLKAFSIRGRALERDKNEPSRITKLLLAGVDLVDRPSNPKAYFQLAKFEDLPKPSKPAKETKSMSDELLQKFEETSAKLTAGLAKVTESITALTGRIDAIEQGSKVPIVLKAEMDGKPVEFRGEDIAKLAKDFATVRAELDTTKAAVLENTRSEIIAKMDREGRTPINPDTNVAYKLDDLKKMDIATLRILAQNSPVVPLASRTSLLKSEPDQGKPQVDPNLKGFDRVVAINEAKYPSLDEVMKRAAI